MKDWAAVVAAGLALPGVGQGTTYGRSLSKLRGRMLAATTAPDPNSFVLHVPIEEKEVLLLARAWWDRATVAQRRRHGDRP